MHEGVDRIIPRAMHAPESKLSYLLSSPINLIITAVGRQSVMETNLSAIRVNPRVDRMRCVRASPISLLQAIESPTYVFLSVLGLKIPYESLEPRRILMICTIVTRIFGAMPFTWNRC